MAKTAPRRSVILSPEAQESLDEIWNWNCERYSPSRADSYLRLLYKEIDSLSDPNVVGRHIKGFANLRFLLCRKRASSHGHVIVFRLGESTIDVARIFHTAQDRQSQLGQQ